MKKHYYIILTLISLFFSFEGISQGGYFLARGKFLDSKTSLPLAEAYISIPSTGYGTSPNLDGNFLFQFPNINIDSQVVVSMMGYNSINIKARELKADSNVFYLEKRELFDASYGLSDVRIMLRAAIDSIPVNYSSTPIYQNGFYQEQVNLPSIGAIKVNEAILRVERFPDPKAKSEKIKLLRGRRLEWKGQTAKIEGWGFQNGSQLVCRSLETSLPEFLQKKQMNKYDFRLDSLMTIFDGQPLFIIHFWPLNDKLKAGKLGKIYLEPESKAIVRIEYEMTKSGLKDLVTSNLGPVKINGKAVKYYTQYRVFQGKWRLQESKITFNVNFEDRLDKKFKINSDILMRYVVFENLPLIISNIYPNEILTSTNNFPSGGTLGGDYWSPFNYLISTVETEKLSSFLRR